MATILIVEDNEQLRIWLRTLLENKGHDVLEAEDGTKALAHLNLARPDLIVLDIYLPDKDGMETLLHLRSSSQKFKILAISGKFNGGTGTDALAMILGASDTLAKPFTATVFIERVERVLTLAVEIRRRHHVVVIVAELVRWPKTG